VGGPENLLVTTNLEAEEEHDDDGMDGDDDKEVPSGEQGDGIGCRYSRLRILNMFPSMMLHRKKRSTILDDGHCIHFNHDSIRRRIILDTSPH